IDSNEARILALRATRLSRSIPMGSIDSTASRTPALRADRLSHHVPSISIRSLQLIPGIRPAQHAALGAGSELVVLVFEQDPRIFDCRCPIADCEERTGLADPRCAAATARPE